MNSFSCVITGHRPTRFKFKYNEKDKRCQRIKKCLQEQLIRLYHQGVRCFWVGGAMGVDMWAAELLLRMKEQQAYQDVELCLALPFEGYNADWDDWHRKRMDFIRRYAEKVLVLGEIASIILLSICSSWSATDNIKNLPILFTSFLLLMCISSGSVFGKS